MTGDQTYYTLQTAIAYGGNFYAKLARAALAADPENKALIFKTWPRLVSQYGPNTPCYESTFKGES